MKKINCILLVDDNEADNTYHSIIIREAGVCNYVKVAVDGMEALEYLKKSADSDNANTFPKPDLIFLDINMPRMNGFEFIMEYHKLEKQLREGIIMAMLTTSLNPDDKTRAKTNEIGVFIIKPLTVEIVRNIIEKYF